VKGTLDRRDDALRAVAQKARVLTAADRQERPRFEGNENGNDHKESESPLVLCFSPNATIEELRQVQTILAGAPGTSPVRLMICRPEGESVQIEAGINLRVTLTQQLRERLQPWLQREELASVS
jgi:hypothetical protein